MYLSSSLSPPFFFFLLSLSLSSLKVPDHSVCSLLLEEGIKSKGQDFAGIDHFPFLLLRLHKLIF